MDCRPDIETSASDAGRVRCEQVVFTSTQTPMGEGYRIVSASSGVRGCERSEITRRSPSHDSLCDRSPTSAGLLSIGLGSGRHGVGYSRYAGTEHTGRGGRRVYTRMVVLDREGFLRFGCNPVAVLAALTRATVGMAIVRDEGELGPLWLEAGSAAVMGEAPVSDEVVEAVVRAVGAGGRVIVAAGKGGLAILESVLLAVPMLVREPVSSSVGLVWCPLREVQVTIVDAMDQDVRRSVGAEVELVQVAE